MQISTEQNCFRSEQSRINRADLSEDLIPGCPWWGASILEYRLGEESRPDSSAQNFNIRIVREESPLLSPLVARLKIRVKHYFTST